MLEHLITARIHVFEGYNKYTVLGELIGSMNRISAPFVIGNMVKHMTDQPHLHLGGQDGGHDRAVQDLSRGTSRSKYRAHSRVGFYRIHMLEMLHHKTGEVPSSGAPIDRVRLGRIGGKYFSKDLAHIHAAPKASQKGSKGLRILRTIPVKALHR
jgi:hypothetical protein